MAPEKMLELVIDNTDLGRVTIREYMKALLDELLTSGESFSGKRPFGNSGWEGFAAAALITAKQLKGMTDDEEGYAYGYDEQEYAELLSKMVEAL